MEAVTMLIWQGYGWVAPILPILGYLLVAKLIGATAGQAYIGTHAWPGALGTLVGAALVFWLGRKLSQPGRVLVDEATGERVVLRKRHTFFFIPMEYCALLLLIVAIGMLIFRKDSAV